MSSARVHADEFRDGAKMVNDHRGQREAQREGQQVVENLAPILGT